MSQINFKLLYVFVAVAETRSFRLAAEQLNRSQSVVSMQIKQLEAQIGVALFHRTTRRTDLTPEGAKLLSYARRALAEWNTGLIEIRDAVDMQQGTLSFACIPTIAATILPKILHEFQKSYPGINISLRELAAEDLLGSIRQKDVDFGIGVTVPGRSDFRFDHLFDDPIYAVATPNFRFRKRNSVDLKELGNYPILLNSKSTALRNLLEKTFAPEGLQLDIKFEVAHTHTIVALAEAGMGVGILPKIALPQATRKTLTALPIGTPALSRSVSVVSLKGQSLPPAARAMIEIFQACDPDK
ncbi:LysR family transcriptional regulator [Nitratireductor alexandrii]|uniref:LysR family transcriptional regulator n=1 Tax=Nitratireductor alexandrii TaxID=2448161 RepID=UPI000FDC973A|nr:LysR family transcriptional regulator [Nitratireductor alexandrii]